MLVLGDDSRGKPPELDHGCGPEPRLRRLVRHDGQPVVLSPARHHDRAARLQGVVDPADGRPAESRLGRRARARQDLQPAGPRRCCQARPAPATASPSGLRPAGLPATPRTPAAAGSMRPARPGTARPGRAAGRQDRISRQWPRVHLVTERLAHIGSKQERELATGELH
jgi:hypothetical protein